ncbi:MAG: Ig-like domain-containing protein [Fibrobacterales bacterium]
MKNFAFFAGILFVSLLLMVFSGCIGSNDSGTVSRDYSIRVSSEFPLDSIVFDYTVGDVAYRASYIGSGFVQIKTDTNYEVSHTIILSGPSDKAVVQMEYIGYSQGFPVIGISRSFVLSDKTIPAVSITKYPFIDVLNDYESSTSELTKSALLDSLVLAAAVTASDSVAQVIIATYVTMDGVVEETFVTQLYDLLDATYDANIALEIVKERVPEGINVEEILAEVTSSSQASGDPDPIVSSSEEVPSVSSEVTHTSESSSAPVSSSVAPSSSVTLSSSSVVLSSSEELSSSIAVESSSVEIYSSEEVIKYTLTIVSEDDSKLTVSPASYEVDNVVSTEVAVTVMGVGGNTFNAWDISSNCAINQQIPLIVSCTGDGTVTALYVPIAVADVSIQGGLIHTLSPTDETLTLVAELSPQNASNQEVDWNSQNNAVATVDSEGVVTARGIGSTTVTVTSKDNNSLSYNTVIRVASFDAVYNSGVSNVFSTATLGDGTYVVAYSTGTSGNEKGVFDLYSPEGIQLGGSHEFIITKPYDIKVTKASEERFAIVYQAEYNTNSMLETTFKLFENDGTFVLERFIRDAPSTLMPVSSLGDNGFVVGHYFEQNDPAKDDDNRLYFYDKNGNTQVGFFPFRSYNGVAYALDVLENGNVVLGCDATPTSYARSLKIINTYDFGTIDKEIWLHAKETYGLDIATLSTGDFVLVYHAADITYPTIRLFNIDGDEIGSARTINNSSLVATNITVKALSNGKFALSFIDSVTQQAYWSVIYQNIVNVHDKIYYEKISTDQITKLSMTTLDNDNVVFMYDTPNESIMKIIKTDYYIPGD